MSEPLDVACREADAGEIPSAAQRFLALATAAGWEVRPTYARRGGRTSLALRCAKRGRLPIAVVWRDGRYSGAYAPLIRLGDMRLPLRLSAREAAEYVRR